MPVIRDGATAASVAALQVGIDSLISDIENRTSAVYPTLAAGVTLTSGAAWALGALVEIIPASTITTIFQIETIHMTALSAVDEYELELYYGAGDTPCGRVAFTRNSNQSHPPFMLCNTVLIPANSRIRGALASASGTDTAAIKVGYHTHP